MSERFASPSVLSFSFTYPYPLSFLTSSPPLPSSSTPEAGGHQPGAALAVGLKDRRQRMRPRLRSVSHTHSLSFGGRPCHYNTPSLSSTLHSQPPLEGCPCYYNTLSLKLGSQYIRRIAPSGSAVIASCHEDRNEFYPREAALRDGTMRHIIVNLALLFTLPSSPGTSQQWRRRKEDGTLSSRLLHLSPPYGALT